jgi:3-methyl-2-oxobutanoate hydroxymethyltransferase
VTKSVTTRAIQKRKQAGEKLVMLTAYDYPTARLADECGADILLVGDSLGTTVMGYDDTLAVTMDDMIHHTRMVSRAASHAFVVGDMPFLSYQVSAEDALRNAGRFVQEAGASAVKLEGGVDKFGDAIRAIIRAGIPLMGHIGLTPQSVNVFGGYRVQGRDAQSRERLKEEALGLQEAGCFSLVLECIPSDLAAEITGSLAIPTIGIGAGPACDGQVLVCYDILGWGTAKFTKTYSDVRGAMSAAFTSFAEEVRAGVYPGEEHQYKS